MIYITDISRGGNMNTALSETQLKLLAIGKKEFLAKGFKNASLREIVKEAGFTLGAFYGYYPNKEALFNALVEEPGQKLLDMYLDTVKSFETYDIGKQVAHLDVDPVEGTAEMVNYIYAHFDAFKLIVCCSAGTAYETYIDKLVEYEVECTYRFIEALKIAGYSVPEIDEQMAHILANALFSGMFEIVAHDMPREKSAIYLQHLQAFFTAGWKKILGL